MSNSYFSDFPFQNRFIEIEGIQFHYIDEGDRTKPAILFLHGVPTWSFTFRNIIPVCLTAGYRTIAPDMPGYGLSEKLSDPKRYTLENLSAWLAEFFIKMKLKQVFIFGHDWGVILGMILAARYPTEFLGLIACNGFLPVIPAKASLAFHLWRFFTKYSPFLPVGEIVNLGCDRKLTTGEKNGYNYPFLKNKDKIAFRLLPDLVPLNDNDPGADIIKTTWDEMRNWHKPFQTVFSDNDPITRNGQNILQQMIPGTKYQPRRILHGKHFLQEDAPLEIGKIINEFVKMNS